MERERNKLFEAREIKIEVERKRKGDTLEKSRDRWMRKKERWEKIMESKYNR